MWNTGSVMVLLQDAMVPLLLAEKNLVSPTHGRPQKTCELSFFQSSSCTVVVPSRKCILVILLEDREAISPGNPPSEGTHSVSRSC